MDNINIIESKIKEHFSFLYKEHNYSKEPLLKSHDDNLLVQWYSYIYINPSNKREITINYFPFDKDKNIVNSFSITITKVPYDSVDDYLNFELFLKKKISDFELKKLSLEFYDGNFEAKLDNVLGLLVSLLKEYASSIIEGRGWEEDCYPKW